MNPFAGEKIQQIFKAHSRNPNLIGTNEGITIEYKKSFGWASLSDYLKDMASFANRDGGYLIFGIDDKPHTMLGLLGDALDRFNTIDNEQWSTHIREYFAPEMVWDKRTCELDGKTYGIIYTYPASTKPVICKKDGGELRKAAIYYRYNAQKSDIDYPELAMIIQNEKNKINEQWMRTIKQIGDIGITKTALLDLQSGRMTGANTTLFIDETLLDEIKFVQEGSFVETGGDPALVVKGEVQTVVGARKVVVERDRVRAINFDDIYKSFIKQENVSSPSEYIKQICYQTTGNLPVYYYIHLAKLSIDETISLVDSIRSNSQVKELLLRRIKNHEVKYQNIGVSTSVASRRKLYYRNALSEQALDVLPKDIDEMKYCIIAMRGLEKQAIMMNKDYLLNLLYRIYMDYFSNPEYERIKPEVRYTICWIDEALYMPE